MAHEEDRRRRAEKIFHSALEIPAAERAGFVDRACGEDAELRAEVDSLLEHQQELGSFLDSPVIEPHLIDPTQPGEDPTREAPHESIGAYRLHRLLGRGGMGEVWLAEQREPIRRQVALKIIKKGMDSREIIARFESERQALALMDHPNVARVLDAGSTPDGAPFFAMEYVDGLPITAYADRRRLDTEQRLRLFQRVCDGVQHAHQKALLHRDLKPSNILVTEIDDEPVPKIIDFGVAKATAQKLTERTMFTQLGVLIGTPEYMSPEQADVGGERVDTRTDVYSLGVLLYELLVGALPFEPEHLRSAGFERVCEILRTQLPSRPSTRVRELGPDSGARAEARRTDPGALRRRLDGDLDWITMKALEKEPARRYGTPQEFAADIERHLRDQPVLAGPPSVSYRARKYLRRHALAVGFASVVVLLLIAGIAGTSIGLLRAQREARTAQRVAASMTDLLRSAAPSVALGRDAQVLEEMMERSADGWESELTDAPHVEAELRATVAEVYLELGEYEDARTHAERALDLWRTVHGEQHPSVARSLALVGVALHRSGDYEAARERLSASVEMLRSDGGSGPALASALGRLGSLQGDAGDYGEAERLHREALAIKRAEFGDRNEETVNSLDELATALANQARYAEAESLQRAALSIRRELVDDRHPDLAQGLANLANTLDMRGEREEAERIYRDVIEMKRLLYGDVHPELALTYGQLGVVLGRVQKLDEAAAMHRRALEMRLELFGERHPDTILSMNNLATVLDRQREFDEALDLYERSLRLAREVVGPDHPNVAITLNNIAYVQMAREDFAGAEPALREAVEILMGVLGEDHPNVAGIRSNLGETLFRLGRYDEASEELALAREKVIPAWGADHIAAAKSQAYRGASLARDGQAEEGEAELLEAYETLERTRGGDSNYAQFVVEELIRLYEEGRLSRSEEQLREALATWRSRRADGSG